VLLLLHAPTPPGLLSVLVSPVHTLAVPVIAAGDPLTTNVAVVKQPATVYVIVVVPALPPAVTNPEELMLATPGALLLHVPEGVLLLSVLLPPIQALSVPVIAFGAGLTVTDALLVLAQPELGNVAETVYTPDAAGEA
jgi:hypothetical protein